MRDRVRTDRFRESLLPFDPFTLDDHFEIRESESGRSLRFRLSDQPVFAASERLADRLAHGSANDREVLRIIHRRSVV